MKKDRFNILTLTGDIAREALALQEIYLICSDECQPTCTDRKLHIKQLGQCFADLEKILNKE